MAIFPTGYSDRSGVKATDKVFGYNSDNISNENILIGDINDLAFNSKTTDNLSEGTTNKYYTEARVSANSTVISKADKTNVLEKDNTTAYIPTANYHPATKEYVDTRSLPVANETTQGIIEIATDAEILTGTDTSRTVVPKQVASTIVASNEIIASSNASESLAAGAYVKKKEAVCIKTGTYRIFFTLYAHGGINIGQSYGQIYKNGVAYGTERFLQSYDSSQTYSQDLAFTAGDLIQIYGHLGDNSGISGNINSFQIGAGSFPTMLIPTINL